MKKVLFICTQNACRSQMAEAIVGQALEGLVQPFSAGTEPVRVHPLAIKVLEEDGIDISRARSKHIDEFKGQAFDLVITLCGGAAESCPFWPGQGKRIHVGFDDPAKVEGSNDERLAAFRMVRDDIKRRLVPLVRKELEI